ncbi:hypothetical protein D9M68_667540 [compost metagenome]
MPGVTGQGVGQIRHRDAVPADGHAPLGLGHQLGHVFVVLALDGNAVLDHLEGWQVHEPVPHLEVVGVAEQIGLDLAGALELEAPEVAILNVLEQLWGLLPGEEVVPSEHGSTAFHVETGSNAGAVLHFGVHERRSPAQQDGPIFLPGVMLDASMEFPEAPQVFGCALVVVQDDDAARLVAEFNQYVVLVAEVDQDHVLTGNVGRCFAVDARMELHAGAQGLAHDPCGTEAVGAVVVVDADGLHAAASWSGSLLSCSPASAFVSWA